MGIIDFNCVHAILEEDQMSVHRLMSEVRLLILNGGDCI